MIVVLILAAIILWVATVALAALLATWIAPLTQVAFLDALSFEQWFWIVVLIGVLGLPGVLERRSSD